MLNELVKTTKLSRVEITKIHTEFFRDCPSGKLDKKLFTKMYKELYPFGDATKFCQICYDSVCSCNIILHLVHFQHESHFFIFDLV